MLRIAAQLHNPARNGVKGMLRQVWQTGSRTVVYIGHSNEKVTPVCRSKEHFP